MTSTARPAGSSEDSPQPGAASLRGPARSGTAQPRIVVGVDGSAGGATALTWALRQAVVTGASLDAVSCWQLPPMISGAAGFGSYVDFSAFELNGPTTEALDKAVAAAIGDLAGAEEVTVRTHVLNAYPARALLEVAEGADLLVVGSRGHGELSSVVLGSVGLSCVMHGPCPVVVVRGTGAGRGLGD